MWSSKRSRRSRPSNQTEEYPPGFAEVSAFISLDREGGLYRRFRDVSARNILYMQSEIATLNDKLEKLDKEDAAATDVGEQMRAQMCATDWDSLERLSKTDDRVKQRMDLVQHLRPLSKAYCMCRDNRM